MNSELNLFGEEAQETYRAMFCHLYHVSEPHLPLRNIIHWRLRIAGWRLEKQQLHKQIAFIPKGYFYSIHTPISFLEEIKEIAKQKPITLIPNVRKKITFEYKGLDFIKIPWCYEAIYELRHGIDPDLRAQLGKKRHKEILRIARKADEAYEFIVFSREEAKKTETLQIFEKSHSYNTLKYNHGLNTYSLAVLEALAKSSLGNQMVIAVRREKNTGKTVSATLALINIKSKEMIQVARGIDHDNVPHNHNLYVADTYKLYQWGVEQGITYFNLGRDSPLIKRSLGANLFFLLENLIHLKDAIFLPEVNTIKKFSEERLKEERQLLLDKEFTEVLVNDEPGLSWK